MKLACFKFKPKVKTPTELSLFMDWWTKELQANEQAVPLSSYDSVDGVLPTDEEAVQVLHIYQGLEQAHNWLSERL